MRISNLLEDSYKKLDSVIDNTINQFWITLKF